MYRPKLNFAILVFSSLLSCAHASTIGGKVVEDHSGRPLPSAEIRVIPVNGSELVADLEANSDGNFELPDLPSGDYRVEVSKPNFVTTTLQLWAGSGAPSSLIARLIRCGVITGRISDLEGQAVHTATVFAMSPLSGNGPMRPFSRFERGHESSVDENGNYRLFNLAPDNMR